MSLEGKKCVVLNASYEPLAIVSAKRALVLVYEGKADIVEEHSDEIIHTPSDIWPLPTQVVLKKYVKSRSTYRIPAILSQRNLFVRDKYTCQYCGRHRSEFSDDEILTRDHVVPRSCGGQDIWTNVVTACSTCNGKKADKLLNRTPLDLISEPSVPTVYEIWSKSKFKTIGYNT